MACGCHELPNRVPPRASGVTEPGAVATGCEHSSREDRFKIEVELSIHFAKPELQNRER
jgi:hypothetical protein